MVEEEVRIVMRRCECPCDHLCHTGSIRYASCTSGWELHSSSNPHDGCPSDGPQVRVCC